MFEEVLVPRLISMLTKTYNFVDEMPLTVIAIDEHGHYCHKYTMQFLSNQNFYNMQWKMINGHNTPQIKSISFQRHKDIT